MQPPLPITRELLLIGGGHTHALVLRMWGMKPLPGVRVTVVNPEPTAPYSGMLPGFIAGHYNREDLDIDLVRLARFAGARFIRGRAEKIDPINRTVTLEDGRELTYHIGALDIGVTSEMKTPDGFSKHATPAKPLSGFANNWQIFLRRCSNNATPAGAVVIGGGVAGIELALAMAHALRTQSGQTPQITLIERNQILPGMKQSRQQFFRERLLQNGVSVLENSRITRIEQDRLILADAHDIGAGFIAGAAGAQAQVWLQNSPLTLENGYVTVDETLRAIDHPTLFAVGDCAHLSHAPRPKAGVFAVRQAPVLFSNLRASLSGGSLKSYNPQSDYMKLISLGKKSALADKWGVMFRGPRVWQLKDRIDRKFMDQFNNLSPMSKPDLPRVVADGVKELMQATPLCGGCGAKIGGLTLTKILANITPNPRTDILTGTGDDAAVLKGPNGGFQVISTDHLRSFTHDPAILARIAAIHALGDIWAMGATPQSALANIVLPPLSNDLQHSWLAEIMEAAQGIFSRQGATIIGGHSSTGAELNIGFTVTGLRRTKPIGKNGARPGDALLLTKPIGTGVILAGEMAMKARGSWVMAAIDSMARCQGETANLLGNAHAMTDVTGFGLAGHLGEIARASDVGYILNLNNVPFLEGALELAEKGVRSSLFEANRAYAKNLIVSPDTKADLLFDPQTAGGLLAAVDPATAEKLVSKIISIGYSAQIIGQITEKSAGQIVH